MSKVMLVRLKGSAMDAYAETRGLRLCGNKKEYFYPAADYEALEKDKDEWEKRCTEEGEETARLFESTKALQAKLDDWHKLADARAKEIAKLSDRLARLVESADGIVGNDSFFGKRLKAAIESAKS